MDKFQEELQKRLQKLQECQKERGFESCLSCEKWENCEVRRDYVESVYRHMSKGADGGFDF